MNVLLNKPKDGLFASNLAEEKGGKAGKRGNKANKNLQFAKDLNREMELMFVDEDLHVNTRPSKKSRKNRDGKRQLQTSGGRSSEPTVI